MDSGNRQGGKVYGELREKQEARLDASNKVILADEEYQGIEALPKRLEIYKKKFMEFDEDDSGDINFMELKRMLEKLDQAKTHLEAKKLMKAINKSCTGKITYREFVDMMFGNSLTAWIVFEEEKDLPSKYKEGYEPHQDVANSEEDSESVPESESIPKVEAELFPRVESEENEPGSPPPDKEIVNLLADKMTIQEGEQSGGSEPNTGQRNDSMVLLGQPDSALEGTQYMQEMRLRRVVPVMPVVPVVVVQPIVLAYPSPPSQANCVYQARY